MEQRNCKNCGAPLQHSYNHKCKYCGTLYDFNVPKEETVVLKPYDMVDLKYRGIEKDIITNSILIKFEGYKIEEPEIYEVSDKNVFVSKSINYINPPKSYFFIRVDLYELEKYGWGLIANMLRRELRYREAEKAFQQIIIHHRDFYSHSNELWRFNDRYGIVD